MFKMIGKKENDAGDKWQGLTEDEKKVRAKIKEKELKLAEEAAAKANEENIVVSTL